MIELQKRYNPRERQLPVNVMFLLNSSDATEITEYIIKVFGKNRYLYICQQAEKEKSYWIVVDEEHTDYWLYTYFDDIIQDYCNYSMFGPDEKSSFPYWFPHWCAFQLTALNLRIWKFKYH